MSVNAWYAVFSVCLFEFTAHIKLHNSGNIFNEEYFKLEFSTSYFKGAYNLFYSDVLFFEREFVWIKRIFHFGGE